MNDILILHHSSTIGGGSISLIDLALLLHTDHNVTVMAPARPDWLGRQLEKSGIKFEASPHRMPIFYHYNGAASGLSGMILFAGGIWTFLRTRRQWETTLAKFNCDTYIVNSSALAPFSWILRRVEARTVCYVRETFPSSSRSIRTRLLSRLLSSFDMILYLSQYDEEIGVPGRAGSAVVRDFLRPGALRVHVKEQAREALGLSHDAVTVLFAGGSSRLKGLHVALRAIGTLTVDGVRLVVAGSVPSSGRGWRQQFRTLLLNPREFVFQRTLTRLVADESIQSRVDFIGEQADMSMAYSAADIVIFPSSLPHQSRPIYEAGYFSLPIVISDFECTREFVTHGRNGLLFNANDPKGLRECLESLALAPKEAVRMGSENYSEFMRTRSMAAIHSRLNRVLSSVRC